MMQKKVLNIGHSLNKFFHFWEFKIGSLSDPCPLHREGRLLVSRGVCARSPRTPHTHLPSPWASLALAISPISTLPTSVALPPPQPLPAIKQAWVAPHSGIKMGCLRRGTLFEEFCIEVLWLQRCWVDPPARKNVSALTGASLSLSWPWTRQNLAYPHLEVFLNAQRVGPIPDFNIIFN